jgi:hypothetical protein
MLKYNIVDLKTTILDQKYKIPGPDNLLKHKRSSENYGKTQESNKTKQQ